MLTDDLGESARVLLRGRGRSLGAALSELAREHANASVTDLVEALKKSPRDQKNALGLLVARVALQEALEAESRELFSRFVFRYGAHLRTSVSEPGLSASQRMCLATAAERVFDSLPDASANQRMDVSAMRSRLSGNAPTEADWLSMIGVSQGEFFTTMAFFAREISMARGSRPKKKRLKEGTQRALRATRKAPAKYNPPTWLSINFTAAPDAHVMATANWTPGEIPEGELTSLAHAWTAYREGHYRDARDELSSVLNTLGDGWSPSNAADALRSWNWLRLVVELAAIESGETPDPRRSWTSVCELMAKCLGDDDPMLDDALQHALGDFVAGDLTSEKARRAYSSRLVVALGHENALVNHTNQEKAQIREGWVEGFGLTGPDARSTVSATTAFSSTLSQGVKKLYLAARSQGSPARALREQLYILGPFLDEGEDGIYHDAVETAQDVERTIKLDTVSHVDLTEMSDAAKSMMDAISASGSVLLQDYVSPLLLNSLRLISQAIAKLGDVSRPELEISLVSSKIPFSSAEGTAFEMRFRVVNGGNASAEGIALNVRASELDINASSRLNSLGPGAEAELSVQALSTGLSPRAVMLECNLEWADAKLQKFSAQQYLPAEDQMPVAWTASDVNPFNLGTISEPERLVGRDADLASLDALIAGRGSAYVTGHKRVGKTSLTKVLIRSIINDRGWAGSLLPLGRALGAEQTAADLVYSLLDTIHHAARAAYGNAMADIPEVEGDASGNFARVANKWLRSAERALPDGARVVVAIDDFDELPPHLIDGPQADSLFLFLRSLIDEEWLNLIMVGSEVLPSIIQSQAHKLNQVAPVSVTNFAARASTAELLETPTRGKLEWMVDAVDRAHYLTSGNPYYETLVAQRLWQNLRERSRSVVTASDVDEAAESVAREAPESHFVHLWADSLSGLDHTSRAAIVSSAVMRSVARCGGSALNPAAGDEVVRIGQGWIQTATNEELHRSATDLVSRGVLKPGPSSGSLLLTIPLVGIWLLQAGGNALDAVYSVSKHATSTTRMLTDADLVGLARQLYYRGEHVTEIRIRAWLEQFGDHYRQYLAFKMLRRMVMDGYFTSTKLQDTVLPKLAAAVSQTAAARRLRREANNHNLRNAYLINHGVPGDSTQGSLSLLAKTLKIKKANILSSAAAVEKVRSADGDVVLFLLDDYCGSGTHLQREMTGLADALTTLGESHLERVSVVVGASVVADLADLPSVVDGVQVETVSGTLLGDRYRPFSANSGVFDSDGERSDAEEMVTSIGRALMKNNPLGFGGRSLLTLFEFNCPNNVAPIFWKGGEVSGEQWVPLFERAV